MREHNRNPGQRCSYTRTRSRHQSVRRKLALSGRQGSRRCSCCRRTCKSSLPLCARCGKVDSFCRCDILPTCTASQDFAHQALVSISRAPRVALRTLSLNDVVVYVNTFVARGTGHLVSFCVGQRRGGATASVDSQRTGQLGRCAGV